MKENYQGNTTIVANKNSILMILLLLPILLIPQILIKTRREFGMELLVGEEFLLFWAYLMLVFLQY